MDLYDVALGIQFELLRDAQTVCLSNPAVSLAKLIMPLQALRLSQEIGVRNDGA